MKRILMATIFIMFAVICCSGEAYAAGKISSISISLKDVDEGGAGVPYTCHVSSGGYTSVIDVSAPEFAKPGQKITITVVLSPIDGYRFVTSGEKKTTVRCDGGKLVSRSIKADEATVKVSYVTKMELCPVSGESLYVDDDVLHWEGVPYCGKYRVNLSGAENKNILVTDETELDLSQFVTTDEEVKVKIQAIPKNGQEKYLFESKWTSLDDSVSASEDNTVTGVFVGKLPSLRFKESDGQYATGWQRIGGTWYLFGPDGYARTGFADIGGNRYYLDPQTAGMQTGWLLHELNWYFFDESGAMRHGWIQEAPGGKWYYLDKASGVLWTNATTPDGYYVDGSGAWVEGR